MKVWFQAILAVGILCVSAASISYTWRTIKAYQLERDAEENCIILLQIADQIKSDISRPDAAALWSAIRQCVNEALHGSASVSDSR